MDAVTDTNVYEPHQWKHSTIVAGVEWKNPVGTAFRNVPARGMPLVL